MNKKALFLVIGVIVLIGFSEYLRYSSTKNYEQDLNYLGLALNTTNSSLCGMISNANFRGECYSKIGIELLDMNICDKDEKTKFYCYTNIAEKTGDEKICAEMKDDYWWNNCFSKVAKAKGDFNLCLSIRNTVKMDDCIKFIAENKTDESICHKIKDEEKKDFCLYNIAIAKDDSIICKSVADPIKKNLCIKNIALNTLNESLCREVTIDLIRSSCITELKEDEII